MLRTARRLGEEMTVKTTFLGAHALPPEYAGRADEYIDFVRDEVLPAAASEVLVMRWTPSASASRSPLLKQVRIFQKAKALGLPVKLHADQLSDSGGAALAAGFRALSADHLGILE
jgi:imidazolonepropionase